MKKNDKKNQPSREEILKELEENIIKIINQFRRDELLGPNVPPTYKQFAFDSLAMTIHNQFKEKIPLLKR